MNQLFINASWFVAVGLFILGIVLTVGEVDTAAGVFGIIVGPALAAVLWWRGLKLSL